VDPKGTRGCRSDDVGHGHHHTNPLDGVSLDVLFAWCDRRPAERYALMARVIIPFAGGNDDVPSNWGPASMALLDRAPDRLSVCRELVEHVNPTSWSGSLAVAMGSRLPLLRQLEEHDDPGVAEIARDARKNLEEDIRKERARETEEDKISDETFE
jgi:hypothetical protein